MFNNAEDAHWMSNVFIQLKALNMGFLLLSCGFQDIFVLKIYKNKHRLGGIFHSCPSIGCKLTKSWRT